MSALRGPGRRAWLALHRWLGLTLGLWFVLLGLTGSALVYYRGLEAQLDARLAPRPPTPGSTAPAMEAVYQALRAAHPQRGAGWRIELPEAPGEPVTARYAKPVETQGRGFAPLLATVDPATQQVVANRFWGETPGTWLYDLHYALLLGATGTQIVGWGGVALAVSLATGLLLWWPSGNAGGRWRRALRFKSGASRVRRVYELHTVGGVWGLLLTGVLTATGALLALPQELGRPLAGLASPLTPMPAPKAPPEDGQDARRIPVDEAITRAEAAFAGSRARWVDTPATPGGLYRVRLRQPGEPGERFPDTLVWLRSTNGEIVARRDPRAYSAGDTLLQWLHPLHSGQAFGAAGRALVCASGLLPLLLVISGVWRWLDKRRAQRRAAAGGQANGQAGAMSFPF